jgi:flagellar motor switch protein FliM
MLGHIEQIQITAEVTIGTVEIAMHDITGMQPGEIVLIGTEAGQQVDLVAEGRPVLSGYMISSKGWYGLKVIDDSDTNN